MRQNILNSFQGFLQLLFLPSTEFGVIDLSLAFLCTVGSLGISRNWICRNNVILRLQCIVVIIPNVEIIIIINITWLSASPSSSGPRSCRDCSCWLLSLHSSRVLAVVEELLYRDPEMVGYVRSITEQDCISELVVEKIYRTSYWPVVFWWIEKKYKWQSKQMPSWIPL